MLYMKLFEQIPSELFSVLSSPNKELYADALGVLYTAYQDNLKLPEKTLYSMIRGKLEQQLCDMILDGEEIDEEERRDISGRARFLIRKLCQKGWFDKERGDDFHMFSARTPHLRLLMTAAAYTKKCQRCTAHMTT